jgi:hypothetical protein
MCFGHAMLPPAGLYIQERQTRGIGTPHIRCSNICGVHDPGPSELSRWSMRGVASLDNVNLNLRCGLALPPPERLRRSLALHPARSSFPAEAITGSH